MTRYLADVGCALRQAREARGLDQAELARAAGIGRRTLIRIEQGQGGQLSTLGRLCLALDLAPDKMGLPGGLATTRARWACLDKVEALPQHGKPGVPAPTGRRGHAVRPPG